MSDHNEHSIGDLLKSFLKQSQIAPGYMNSRIEALWPELMGPSITAMTGSVSMRKQTLVLQIKSAPLRQELLYSKEQIIRLFNEALGEDYIQAVEIR